MRKKFKPIFYRDDAITSEKLFKRGISYTNGEFDVSKYQDVLEGRSLIYIAKSILPEDTCDRICESYFRCKDKYNYQVRPSIESIGRPLYLAKQSEVTSYFDDAESSQIQLDMVFSRAYSENIATNIYRHIAEYFHKMGITVRTIAHHGQNGYYGIMRSWGSNETDEKNRAVRVHEDRLQVLHHEDIETKATFNSPMASTCIYFSNGSSAGKLRVYNYRPSSAEASHEEFDSKFHYGYSDEVIEKQQFLEVRPEPGDVITFLADRYHEVYAAIGGHRISSSFFSSVLPNEKEILVWS